MRAMLGLCYEGPEGSIACAAGEVANTGRGTVPVAFDGFEQFLWCPAPPWRGLVLSGGMHLAAIALLGLLAGAAGEQSEPRVRYRVSSVRSLRIKIPDQLFLPASERPRTREPEGGGPAPGRAPGKSGPGDSQAGRVAQRRKFELPPLPQAKGGQTVIQLSSAPEIAVSPTLRLPTLALWSQSPPVPRPEPKKAVLPGRRQTVTQMPELNAPPQISVSGLAASNALEPLRASEMEAKITVPRPGGLPVRVFAPPRPKGAAEVMIDLPPGEAVNVIALHQNPAALRGLVVIPAGNQVSADLKEPASGLAGLAAGTTGNAGSAAEDQAAGEGGRSSGKEGAGRSGGSGGGDASGERAGAGGQDRNGNGPAGRSGAGSGNGRGTGSAAGSGSSGGALAGEGGAGQGAGQGTLAAEPTPIKILHPQNGVFDIVVVQSSREGSSEASALTGRPVYSVYLKVGTAKEWLLHYCIPKGVDSTRRSGPVITLGSPTKVSAPYPILTLVPNPSILAQVPRTFIHGFLTVKGQLRDLGAVLEGQEAVVNNIARYLKQWEFRPATRDGVPVEIETLLIIPVHGSE